MIKLWRKQWFRRQRRFKRSMRGGRLHAILGRHAFHPKVWRSDKRSIAGGLALGLFTAFLPIPVFQMLLVAVGAILWRVNLPLALAACWVSNPITAVPIFVSAHKVGKTLLTRYEHAEWLVSLFVPQGKMGGIIREGIYLTTGSLLFAVLAAGAGYLAVQLVWMIMERTGVVRKKTGDGRPQTADCRLQTADNGGKSKVESRDDILQPRVDGHVGGERQCELAAGEKDIGDAVPGGAGAS